MSSPTLDPRDSGPAPRTDRATLRPAAPSDVDRLTAFAAKAFRETYASTCRASDIEAYIDAHLTRAAIARTFADPAVAYTLAELPDATIAGYVQVRAGGLPEPGGRLDPTLFPAGASTLELGRIYVDPAFHGQGIAQMLFAHASADAARRGALLWLGVFKNNPRAIAFYRKMGMTPAGTQTFMMGDDPQEDWVMVERSAGAGE